ELEEVISVTPATWLNWRSSGVATEEAMSSALAPGNPADTEMVGKSTCGSGDTGSTVNPIAPAFATATVSSVVATGLRINGAEILIPAPQPALDERSCFLRSSPIPSAPDCQRRCRSPASYTAS